MTKITMSEAAKALQKAYSKELRSKNADKLKQYQKEYHAKNPDKNRMYQAAYWERKAAALIAETLESKVLKLDKQGYSLRQIAAELGTNHMKVARIIRDNRSF